MDKKDMCAFFQELRMMGSYNADDPQITTVLQQNYSAKMDELLDNYTITKLDIRRLYRYFDKNVKKISSVEDDVDEQYEDA